ncbi:MAG TPA: hypothetical protein VGE07_25385 [Herpetosiphonaceae bacterium]
MHQLNIARAFALAVRNDPALADVLAPAYKLLSKTSWSWDDERECVTFADGATVRLGASRCAACPGQSLCLHLGAARIVELALSQSLAGCA